MELVGQAGASVACIACVEAWVPCRALPSMIGMGWHPAHREGAFASMFICHLMSCILDLVVTVDSIGIILKWLPCRGDCHSQHYRA